MWKAAVVEDEREAAERIAEYLGRFGEENGETFDVSYYGDAEAFLAGYDPECDIVFMDIQLPDMSGMDAARALRAVDSEVTLVFVTSMVQYAVSGYEVSALDFIVKPVSYPNFAMKMKRVLRERRLRAPRSDELSLSGEGGVRRVSVSSVKYIEVVGHHLIFHTFDGDADVCGALGEMEKTLAGKGFSRCNNCYLVNLRHVSEIRPASCIVGGEEVQISRRRRKAFMDDLTAYVGGASK